MQEIADVLKAERLKQELTIGFVSEQTRISAGMIEAMESGEFERIGIPLLLRSFIHTYCDVLGIDSAPLLDKYEKAIGTFDRQGKGIRKYREWSRAVRRKGRSRTLLIILLALLALGTLLGGAWFSIWLKQQQSQEKTSGVYPSQELPSDLISQGGALASDEDLDRAGNAWRFRSGDSLGERGSMLASPKGGGRETREPVDKLAKIVGDKPSSSEILPEESDSSPRVTEQPHSLQVEAGKMLRLRLVIDDQSPISVLLKPGETKEWQVLKRAEIERLGGGSARVKWDGLIVDSTKRRFKLPVETKKEKP